MSQRAPAHQPDRNRARAAIYPACFGALLLTMIGFGAVLAHSSLEVADAVRGPNAVQGLHDAVDSTIAFYESWTKLLLTGFGVAAFLMTFAQKGGLQPSTRAWAAVASGLVLLFGAVGLTWIGRERVLMMVAANAVDLEFSMLLWARWFSYAFAALALALFGVFAIELAHPGTSSPNPR